MTKKIRYDIQILRAIAVVAVMLFHMDRDLLPAGFLGVDIFFTISGFVVTQSLLHRIQSTQLASPLGWKEKLRLFRDFMLSRAKRILPAYYFVLLVVSVTALIVFTETDFGFFRRSLKKALYFNSNVFFQNFGDYFAPQSTELPLLHTWSLSVEMKFYLLLPAVLLIAGIYRSKWVLSLLFIGLVVFIEYQTTNRYFYLYSRIPEFLIGVGIALASACKFNRSLRIVLVITGLAVVIWSFFYIKESSIPGLWMLVPCLSTGLIIWANIGLSKNLPVRALSYVGDISYSLYLWHWSVLAFIRYISSNYELTSGLIQLYFGLSIGLSILSFHIIEQPFRKFKSQKYLFIYLLILLSVLIGILSILGKKFNNTLVKPLPIELRRYADPDTICHAGIVGDCIKGDLSQPPIALVIGDSHAAQLNIAFDSLGKRNGMSFKILTSSNCLPIKNFNVEKIPEYSREECTNKINLVESNNFYGIDTLIIAGKWTYQLEDTTYKALDNFLRDHSKDKIIIIFTQTPFFKSNTERVDRFFNLRLESRTKFHNNNEEANKKLIELVKNIGSPNIHIIDLSKSKLFEKAPLYNGKLIIFDGNHLNEYGSFEYGKFFEKDILKYLKR